VGSAGGLLLPALSAARSSICYMQCHQLRLWGMFICLLLACACQLQYIPYMLAAAFDDALHLTFHIRLALVMY
jgi:hypothetical protein